MNLRLVAKRFTHFCLTATLITNSSCYSSHEIADKIVEASCDKHANTIHFYQQWPRTLQNEIQDNQREARAEEIYSLRENSEIFPESMMESAHMFENEQKPFAVESENLSDLSKKIRGSIYDITRLELNKDFEIILYKNESKRNDTEIVIDPFSSDKLISFHYRF